MARRIRSTDASAAEAPPPTGAGPRAPEGNLSVLLLDAALERGLGPRAAVLADGVRWTYADLARRTGAAAARLAEAARRLGPATVIAEEGVLDRRSVPGAAARGATGERAPDPGPARIRRDDPAYLLLTSGSTGPGRWVVHRAGDMAACLATYGRRVLRLAPDDVTWSVASLSTSYGLGNSCYFPLGAGAAAVIEASDRSPARCAEACATQRVTALFGVPTAWSRLARHAAAGRIDRRAFATVRLALSAGEPLPARTWQAVERATGLRLVNALGSSEASNLYLSDSVRHPRPGTVGWPVPGYALALRPLSGRAEGEGELLVRGPSLMSAYLGGGGPPADGWLSTGDVVRRERDGSHTFLGRVGDRFKSGGFWVDPARVRAAIEEMPGVAEAAVIPVEDDDGLLRVGAIVAAADGSEAGLAERVADGARASLRSHELPRTIVVSPSLPTTASGKLDRPRAAAMLAAARARVTRIPS